jgi:hypothetical protein
MYETRTEPVIARGLFARRVASHAALAAGLVACSLVLGMLGYIGIEHLSIADAFLNAAMLLGGMGPIDPPHSTAGKLFAGFYALYAGLVFIVTAALMVTPVLHRLLHRFHWDEAE